MMLRTDTWALLWLMAVSCLLSATARAQERSTAAPDAVQRALDEFLGAHNTGDMARITAWAAANSTGPGYAWSLYQELGPLVVRSREGDVFWCEGEITHAYVGLPFRVTPAGTALTGVRRGPMPIAEAGALSVTQLKGELASYFEASTARGHFSGSVLVGDADGVIFQGAYGMANRDTGLALTLETPMRLASVSKVFTAAAVLLLAQEGRLSVNDPISRLIPEYPDHIGQQVTIHHLLCHTSGIELDGWAPYNTDAASARSIDDLLAAQVRHIEHLNGGNYLKFAPLSRHDYSNENYDLLGVIIQRASGMEWTRYIRTRVMEPAGMHASSFFDPFAKDAPALAVGYTLRNPRAEGFIVGPRQPVEGEISGTPRPAGSAYASAPELFAFARAFFDHRLLDAQHTEQMVTPKVTVGEIPGQSRSYAYGMTVSETPVGKWIGHTGSWLGTSAYFQVQPATGRVIIVLSNFDGTAAVHAGSYIARLLSRVDRRDADAP